MLWLTEHIDLPDPEAVLALIPRLSPARREKTLRYRSPSSRVQSVLAELLLRHALRAERGLTELPEIRTGDRGKPFFPDLPELHFNLSHCRSAAACALDASPVGVDVQQISSGPERRRTSAVMKRFFAEDERIWVEAGRTDAEQNARFTAVWTCKEAYGKATGTGILYPMREIAFLPGEAGWTQAGFTFQTCRRGDVFVTLCAAAPLPLRTVSFSELTKDVLKPDEQ